MEIKLEHHFLKTCHDIKELLQNVKKLNTFISRLERQSQLFPNRYDPDKYKGDGFEFFTEALLKLSPVDNRIAIGNYHPELGDDTGVDGYGIGIDGKPATVQVKFRSNADQQLTANQDHLSNFGFASQNRYGVDVNSTTNMLIVTSASGLHYFTEEHMLLNKVRVLGRETLRDLVDNNELFWNNFRKIVENSLNS
jgi:hypothetical protein